jgi:hypothetical protein
MIHPSETGRAGVDPHRAGKYVDDPDGCRIELAGRSALSRV